MKPFKLLSFVIASCLYITSCSNNTSVITTGECIVPKYPSGYVYPDTDIIFPDKQYIGEYLVIDSAIYTEIRTDNNMYYQSENIFTHVKKTLTDAKTIENLILSNPFKSNRNIGFIRLERKISDNLYLFAYNFNLIGVDTLGNSSNLRFDFAIYDKLNNKVLDINYGDFYNYIGFSFVPFITFEYENNDIFVNISVWDVLQLTKFNSYERFKIRTALFHNNIIPINEEIQFLSKSKNIKVITQKKKSDDYTLVNLINGFTLNNYQDSIYLDRTVLVTEDDSLFISGFVYKNKDNNNLYIQNLFTKELQIIDMTEKYCLYGIGFINILNNEEIIFQAAFIPDMKYYLYKYNMKTKTLSKIDLMF